MLATASPLAASPAHAAPGDAFDGARATVFVAQNAAGAGTGLFRSETEGDGTFAFTAEGAPASGTYNAIGYNTADDYIYGSTTSTIGTIPPRAFVRIGQDGVVTRVGTYTFPFAQYAGAFNADDGLYYSTQWTSGQPTLYALNAATGTVAFTRTIAGTGWGVADFEYLGGYFWGVDSMGNLPPGTLMRIDPSNGAVAFFESVIPDAAAGSWGAAWRFGNGNLGFSHNASGTIAQIKITNPEAAAPTFEIVDVVRGPLSNGNDGTAIPGDPVDLAITKEGPATFRPGGTISYTLTVTNEGPGESSGWVIKDAAPSELSNVTASGDGTCTVVGNNVSCSGGRLTAGASAEIVLTGDTATTERACLTNTASVGGNEKDDDESNNANSATSCAQLIEVTKSSDASAQTRVGDTVTYQVSATNVGASDFTEAEPAYVFDDLSAVVDDAVYNDDATASRPGSTSYNAPVLTWSGALAAGETVDLEYSVTLRAGGDGLVRNVAWEPEDPNAPTPPDCDPAVDGQDAATGETCAQSEFLLPKLSIDKSANRTDLPAAGESVEYTVTIRNQGPGDFTSEEPATFTDDLSAVLDDATLDSGAAASVGTVSFASPELSWTGVLASGESATITYSVTYTGDGDQILTNHACLPASDIATGHPQCDTVTIPGSGLSQWKQATASSSPLVAGSTITYTLFFDNDGQAAATVDAVDDLTHVLDDADVTVEPSSADGLTTVRNGAEISVSGSVPAGELYTVTYAVTVLPDAQRGDDTASNFLLAPGEEPPTDGVCDPADSAAPTCTSNPISGISYDKTVVASETPVREGTELTYTVVVTNTGATTVDVARDDDLSDVLDDASLTTAPQSDTSSVTVDGPEDGVLQIRGTLAVGEVAEITYTATVNAQSDRGNSTAANYLVAPGQAPDPDCDPADGQCTVTPIQSYTVSKTADSAVAAPGEVITYTVEIANTGATAFTAADPVSFTDDLSAVLDDAVYNDDVSAGGTVEDDVLTWSGALDVGETAEVTYSVTVNDPATGDGVLTNAVVPQTPGGDCAPDADCSVSTLVFSYTVEKQASSTTALPGDTIDYTITVTNTGEVDYTADAPASFRDDLSDVLDDAVYNNDASDGASVDDGVLSWAGPLQTGQSLMVTYSVTINDPVTGDQNLSNAVVPTSPGGVCAPDQSCETASAVASFAVSKAVDLPSALPGETVTYTVTVTNTGAVDYSDLAPASFTDDLSGVLDDATYNGDASEGASVTGSTLTWTGALAAGATVDVTYSVTLDDPITGDHELVNVVTPAAPGGECDEQCSTQTPVGSFRVEKSTTSTEVLPGEIVEYEIVVANTGQTAFTNDAPASFVDDLSKVLDDATYNGDASSSRGDSVDVTGGVISWSGPLAIGESITVTYSVTVSDSLTGDQLLQNAVVTPPGAGGNCAVGSSDPACVANVPSGSFTVSKTSDLESAFPGEVVTYTITVTNTGPIDYTEEEPVSFTDDLSRVLDDASYNEDVSHGGALVGTELVWSGPLAAGESVDVTYSVTVHAPVTGDSMLRNIVAPTAPGGSCVEGGCVTQTPVASYAVAKSASEADVFLGGTVTYTVIVTNTGQVDYSAEQPASISDDLSGVLDDATFNDDATQGAVVSGTKLSWSGGIEVGQSVTITYSVTVEQPATGDGLLRNAVVGDAPGGACSLTGECVTETPIASYAVSKTASTQSATIGDTIVYSISVTNTGQVDFTEERPASFTDDLSDALALGEYNGDLTHDGTFASPVLSWAGALAVGETVTLTYSVTVAHAGTIENVVVTPPGSGGNCDAESSDPDCQTVTPVLPPLAVTGGQIWGIGGAVGAVLLGLGAWFVARRRAVATMG